MSPGFSPSSPNVYTPTSPSFVPQSPYAGATILTNQSLVQFSPASPRCKRGITPTAPCQSQLKFFSKNLPNPTSKRTPYSSSLSSLIAQEVQHPRSLTHQHRQLSILHHQATHQLVRSPLLRRRAFRQLHFIIPTFRPNLPSIQMTECITAGSVEWKAS